VTRSVPQRELRNQNARIINEVAEGATFIVTRNGEPVAELRPIPRGRRNFVSATEVAALAGNGPHIDAIAFRNDLDSIVEQSVKR
jgi:prevent-host-death family protein